MTLAKFLTLLIICLIGLSVLAICTIVIIRTIMSDKEK